MRPKMTAALLLAGAACLLLAGCQAKDDITPGVDTFRSLTKLVASDAGDSDRFGLSIAVAGNLAVVGSPGEDGAGANRGAVYIFLGTQGGTDNWGEVKKLTASDGQDEDLFGISVAISGDTIVVGAGGVDGVGSTRGAVYVFYRNQGGADNWGEVKKLMASDASNDDALGFAVAIDGDVLIAGAEGEDGAGTDRGAAYVFYRDQGGVDGWGQVKKIMADDAANGDEFGYALDLQGDHALIGAPGKAGAGSNRGAVYVLYRDQGGADNWGEIREMMPNDAANDVWFGSAVALDGTDAVVGAAWDDGGGTNRGAAYVFSQNQGGTDNWGQVKKLVASDPKDDALFGYAVDIDGDFIVAGAISHPGGGSQRGQSYVFSRNNGGTANWGEVQGLRASDGATADGFGSGIALKGLYLIIGATGEDGAGTDRGAAYVFRKI